MQESCVAPLVGAWIEIFVLKDESIVGGVAPLVGAWIEIQLHSTGSLQAVSRSPRGSVD